MNATRNRAMVDQGLLILRDHLGPVIEATLSSALKGLPWTVILEELDRQKGKLPGRYDPRDVQTQLKVINRRLGKLGFPFENDSKLVGTYSWEITQVRNSWAHSHPFDDVDTLRALETMARLLLQLGDRSGAEKLSLLRNTVLSFSEVDGQRDEQEEATVSTLPVEVSGDAEANPEECDLETNGEGLPVTGNQRATFEAWRGTRSSSVDDLDHLRRKEAKERVQEVIREVVDIEGPVSTDRVVTTVCRAFGCSATKKRKAAVKYQISVSGLVVDDHGFVWPDDIDRATWQEFRPKGDRGTRPMTDISPMEIANAISHVVRRSPQGLSRDELDYRVLQIFGWKKKVTTARRQLELAHAVRVLRAERAGKS